eukprot:g12914.t1
MAVLEQSFVDDLNPKNTLKEELMGAVPTVEAISQEMEEVEAELAANPEDEQEIMRLSNRLSELTDMKEDYKVDKVKEILKLVAKQVGFLEEDMDRPVNLFSGGWKAGSARTGPVATRPPGRSALAGPIYIARSVGVKRRTKVMFVFSSLTGVALCGAPLIASLLEIFVKELRIGDLLLNSDTMPGWFMAVVYFIYMLLIVFCFEDSSRDETSLSPNLLEEGESCWKPGLWVCLFASFLSTTTKTMCVVFFVKLSEQTWGLSISSTGFALAGAMALVTAANSVALQLGRGLGAQLGAVMSITGFAASQVLSYFLLAGWPYNTLFCAWSAPDLGSPDVLLLDEPTNHLDLEAVEWLEKFLRTQDLPMVIVTHDREFMNRDV